MRSLLLAATAQIAAAHFQIEYPSWRADSLSGTAGNYSQWVYPCAGVPNGVGNRTEWPLTGGSISLNLHHPWTYVYVNLGLGDAVTNFNYSLTPEFVNVTGNGTYCIPSIPVPIDVADGQNASIQVVTSGEEGAALYNCADIVFRSSAKPLSGDQCKNTTVSATYVGQSSDATNSTSNSTTSSGKSAAPGMGVNFVSLTGVVAFATMFAIGLTM